MSDFLVPEFLQRINLHNDEPVDTMEPTFSTKQKSQDIDFEEDFAQLNKQMGTARDLADDAFSKVKRAVLAVFSKAGATDEEGIKKALAYYHLVQSTSPRVQWIQAPPVVVDGCFVRPELYVHVITTGTYRTTLRNFMRQYVGELGVKYASTRKAAEVFSERLVALGGEIGGTAALCDFAPAGDFASSIMRASIKTRAIQGADGPPNNSFQRQAVQVSEERVAFKQHRAPSQSGASYESAF